MAKLLDVMPFLRCARIDDATHFFTEVLGFRIDLKEGDFARASRDDVTFLLFGDGVELAPRGGGRYTSYVAVDDVDALYSELRPRLDGLPRGHVNPPCDMDYGRRDFSVIGPDGDLIGFGSPLSS